MQHAETSCDTGTFNFGSRPGRTIRDRGMIRHRDVVPILQGNGFRKLIPMCDSTSDIAEGLSWEVSRAQSGCAVRSGGDLPGKARSRVLGCYKLKCALVSECVHGGRCSDSVETFGDPGCLHYIIDPDMEPKPLVKLRPGGYLRQLRQRRMVWREEIGAFPVLLTGRKKELEHNVPNRGEQACKYQDTRW